MDPFRVAIRCLVAYVFLLALLRLSGKRTLRETTPFEFVMGLILGDLVDDAIWAEVPVAQFIVAAATLTFAELVGAAHKGGAPAK